MARFAGDFDSDILGRHSQPLGTFRAVDVNPDLLDLGGREVEEKAAVALFARDRLTDIPGVDAQLTVTLRAVEIEAARLDFGDRFDLLERNELGNLDTVGFEVVVEKCAAVVTMNQPLGHLFATDGTWTAGPRGHRLLLLNWNSFIRMTQNGT
jgi:hypothetical protein